MKTWGIYDGKDKKWMGNDDGPIRCASFAINGRQVSGKTQARLAATILCEMMAPFGPPQWGRYRAKEIPPDINKRYDEVKSAITPREAVAKIEGFHDGS